MRLIDADGLMYTTRIGVVFALMLTTDEVKKEISKAMYKFIKERVDDAPTIESEPVRHGEWKVIRLHNNGYYFVCSECNEEGYLENYCPNCGTKMDRGDE